MVKTTGLFLFFLCLIFNSSKADVWGDPTCKKYYTQDSSKYIVVVPACLMADKKRIIRQKKRAEIDVCDICDSIRPCSASVYDANGVFMYQFQLINFWSPSKVYLSNDGEYAVSIDNWGMAGSGNSVLVIYKRGILLKNYALSEISPIPLDNYYRTLSSISWCHNLEFITNTIVKISFMDKDHKQFEKYLYLEKIN
jgi:hypothetical protein